MAVRMPSASTSTLSIRSASMSSLSHSRKVRSGLFATWAPLWIGTVSSRRSRVRPTPATAPGGGRATTNAGAVTPPPRPPPHPGAAQAAPGPTQPRPAPPRLGEVVIADAPDEAGQRGGHVLLEAQRLADLADGHARAVVDDGGADGGAVAAVAGIEILDHLLAPLVLEVHVDVG